MKRKQSKRYVSYKAPMTAEEKLAFNIAIHKMFIEKHKQFIRELKKGK